MAKRRKNVKPSRRSRRRQKLPATLQRLNLNAAGIDVGATEHYVAVPEDRDPQPVRHFGTFTADLHALADWLQQCGIKTVAMESTGVYWIPLFQILETLGFEVLLVNARQIKNVPGRKSDVLDCQWIQQLHTYGLLSGSFRPSDQICGWRSYVRHRQNLIEQACLHTQHMQKALSEMNVQLHHVLSDLTGVSGLAILEAILAGERDGMKLAALRDPRVKSSPETIAQALQGDYRSEHLFVLRQALEAYRFCQAQIAQCDREVEALLKTFEAQVDLAEKPLPPPRHARAKPRKNEPHFDLRLHLYRVAGVDLTQLPGLDVVSVQALLSEIGTNTHKWPSEKHFASWLTLCPNNRVSGGKVLDRRTRRDGNRASHTLHLAAYGLMDSQSSLGAFFRRLRARIGTPKALTATAHKLARLLYRTLKFGQAYVDQGEQYYEQRYRNSVLRNLRKRAATLGFVLVEKEAVNA